MEIDTTDFHIPTPLRRRDVRKKNHGRAVRPYRWVVVGLKPPPNLINA